MHYYKLVNYINDKYYSQFSILSIEYKLNERTRPVIGKLFLYDDLEYAKKWPRYKLFRCEVKNPNKPALILHPTLAMINPIYISSFWAGDIRSRYLYYPTGYRKNDDGTIFNPVITAEEVMLVEQLT